MPGSPEVRADGRRISSRSIDNALDKVKRLRGVYFDWEESGKRGIGILG